MSRELTTHEIKEEFIKNVCEICDYWSKVEEKDFRENIIGAVFSVLAMLDGEALASPAFIVAPYPHKSDKEYNISRGENYYPYNNHKDIKGDIAGSLHDVFMQNVYDYMGMSE